tara:strand:+ start:959 stop:1075 length:117 start_codon:yes stop_codon:yes gene_type:complete
MKEEGMSEGSIKGKMFFAFSLGALFGVIYGSMMTQTLC